MSQTILYRQLDISKSLEIETHCPRAFGLAMYKVFGESPWRLENDPAVMRRLEGMEAVYGETPPNPYEQIIERIEELGGIEVFMSS